MFDVGVANYLARRSVEVLKGDNAGKGFEHFILMELVAYLSTVQQRTDIQYWRTKTGLEVDFILGDAAVALEVKISETVHQQDIKGLIVFCEEHPTTKGIVISQDKRARQITINDTLSISVMPWTQFLKKLWGGEII
jgi:predicted AAA+ superfamily ATPase